MESFENIVQEQFLPLSQCFQMSSNEYLWSKGLNKYLISSYDSIYRKVKKEKKDWDKFTTTTKDNISSSDVKFWEKVFVVTKIVVAFFLFVFTFGSAVVSKVCLVIVTANIYPREDSSPPINKLKTLDGMLEYTHKQTNVQWIWALIMMAGAPYFFTSIKCLWRLLFQMTGTRSPSLKALLGVTCLMLTLL